MRARQILYLVAASLLIASCSAGNGSTSSPSTAKPNSTTTPSSSLPSTTLEATTTMPAATTTTSPGCPVGGSKISTSIRVQNLDRTFVIEMPDISDSAKIPVILNFHGLGSNAAQQRLYTAMAASANPRGFMVVTADGVDTPLRWPLEGIDSEEPATINFTAELIDELISDYCADPQRIYATGFSNGGLVASMLGCLSSNRIRAVAPVALTAWSDLLCGDGGPMPILSFHGTDDEVVKFDGSSSPLVSLGRIGDVRENMEKWAEHNDCTERATETELSGEVTQLAWTCPEDAETLLYIINGGGHTWPGAFPISLLGYTTQDIDATDYILDFFERH